MDHINGQVVIAPESECQQNQPLRRKEDLQCQAETHCSNLIIFWNKKGLEVRGGSKHLAKE